MGVELRHDRYEPNVDLPSLRRTRTSLERATADAPSCRWGMPRFRQPIASAPGNPKHLSVAESPGRTERAGAARYGIAGAGLVSGIDNLNEVLHGRKGVGQALTDTGLGGLSAVSSEALARRLSSCAASTGTDLRNGFAAAKAGFKAGAVVDAVTGGLFSTWDNAAAYRSGRETAGQATAKVLVDTGVGIGSGLAGAAAGAAIGSVLPMASTAVGALLGFGVGWREAGSPIRPSPKAASRTTPRPSWAARSTTSTSR